MASVEHELGFRGEELEEEFEDASENSLDSYDELYPVGNPQDLYPDLYPKRKSKLPKISRRELLGLTAGVLILDDGIRFGKNIIEEARKRLEVETEQESQQEEVIIPSLPDGYINGTAIVDFTQNIQLDTESFGKETFDPQAIDFINKYKDVDIKRPFIVTNPLIDIRENEDGTLSPWLLLTAYIDSDSPDYINGGSYRGIYINMQPKEDNFTPVLYSGKIYAIAESTPEQIVNLSSTVLIRTSDKVVVPGEIIGTISQEPELFTDTYQNKTSNIPQVLRYHQ